MNWARSNRFRTHDRHATYRLWAVFGTPGVRPRPSQLSVWMALVSQLPDVRIDEVISVRQRLADETYDVPAALDVALDRAIEELQEQPVFLAPDQN